MRSVIDQLLANHSGQSIEKIEQDVERDFIMSAQQAKEYGCLRIIPGKAESNVVHWISA
jgi:ATP-dependent Clp protease protease subunit